jgi:hypothetical protein
MFSINLKLEVYWSFFLIFDTISHKTSRSGQKGMQNITDGQKESLIFWVAKREVQVCLMAKREFSLESSSPTSPRRVHFITTPLPVDEWRRWIDIFSCRLPFSLLTSEILPRAPVGPRPSPLNSIPGLTDLLWSDRETESVSEFERRRGRPVA